MGFILRDAETKIKKTDVLLSRRKTCNWTMNSEETWDKVVFLFMLSMSIEICLMSKQGKWQQDDLNKQANKQHPSQSAHPNDELLSRK